MMQLSFADHMTTVAKASFSAICKSLEEASYEVGGYDYEEEEHYAQQLDMELEDISYIW